MLILSRHIRWQIQRVKKRFSFIWWRQYSQEKHFSQSIRRPSHLTMITARFRHLDSHSGVYRLRSLAYFQICSRHVSWFFAAHFESWLSRCAIGRRTRNLLQRNAKYARVHLQQQVFSLWWEALRRYEGKNASQQSQSSLYSHSKKWQSMIKFLDCTIFARELEFFFLWHKSISNHRLAARHLAKRRHNLVMVAFDAIVGSLQRSVQVRERRSMHF